MVVAQCFSLKKSAGGFLHGPGRKRNCAMKTRRQDAGTSGSSYSTIPHNGERVMNVRSNLMIEPTNMAIHINRNFVISLRTGMVDLCQPRFGGSHRTGSMPLSQLLTNNRGGVHFHNRSCCISAHRDQGPLGQNQSYFLLMSTWEVSPARPQS